MPGSLHPPICFNHVVVLMILFITLRAGMLRAEETVSGHHLLRGVIHAHTGHSCGWLELDEVLALAEKQGLEFLVISDHDTAEAQYGIPPARNFWKLSRKRSYLLDKGMKEYFADIERADREHPGIIVAAGVETMPHYYWTGKPWSSLTANNAHKHMLLFGMDKVEDFQKVPVLHNGYSTRHTAALLKTFAPFLLLTVLCLSVFPAFRRFSAGFTRRKKFLCRVLHAGLCFLCVSMTISRHPFQSSPFDQYQDYGAKPYQNMIDYVREKGGFVFWAHPEGKFQPDDLTRTVGNVTVALRTEIYPDDLWKTKNASGFPVLYGENTTVEKPGGLWDRLLMQYLRGEREMPLWGFSEADFRGLNPTQALDNFQTFCYVKEKSPAGILEAMRNGRMIAVQGKHGIYCRPDFTLSGEDQIALPGGWLRCAEPEIHFNLSLSNGDNQPFLVEILRGDLEGGFKTVYTKTHHAPVELNWKDDHPPVPGVKAYYRVRALPPNGGHSLQVISNPIFVDLPSR